MSINHSFIHYVSWPVNHSLAFTTTRLFPESFSNSTVTPSLPPFNDFNLGLHVGDDKTKVLAHRESLSEILSTTTQIQWLDQVHSSDVAIIEHHQDKPIRADAAITQSPDIALAIMTADCLPILLVNQEGTECAVIHAGWRPLANGIIKNTITKMTSCSDNLYGWLGPCIGPESFEVGQDVLNSFSEQSLELTKYFKTHKNGKYLADLHSIAEYLLEKQGVNKISKLEHCTYQRHQEYFSFRRDGQTGRMASVIALSKQAEIYK
jgi:purine-nucleoside/S-methyl-5'-thioadenosine phosphorylase / adenosine deaminase